VTTININDAAHRVALSVQVHGGATESVVVGIQSPNSGYAVSLPGYEKVEHVWVEFTSRLHKTAHFRNMADAYAERHRNLLTQPGHYLGAWVDGDRLVFDITQVVPELAVAVRLGVERKQDAIYSFATGNEIQLKSARVSTLTAEQETAWALIRDIKAESLFTVVGRTEYDSLHDELAAPVPRDHDAYRSGA